MDAGMARTFVHAYQCPDLVDVHSPRVPNDLLAPILNLVYINPQYPMQRQPGQTIARLYTAITSGNEATSSISIPKALNGVY